MIFQKHIRNHRLKPFNLDNRKKTLNPRLDQKESNTGDHTLRALSVNAGEGGFFGGFPVAVSKWWFWAALVVVVVEAKGFESGDWNESGFWRWIYSHTTRETRMASVFSNFGR
ncbi:hypothetical protein NC651_024831 [Populus alba x Populus x berolinensis]|nr:hypothetical protein NC651_024831 [Populus alba x Populus x berolinensis]